MVFLILFTLLGTALGQSQLAAITYLDEGTCNLDSDVNVELWVNSAPDVCKLTNVFVNSDTSLTMNELTLTKVESASSILDTIKSTSISAIGDVLKVTATELTTEELDVKIGGINLLKVENDNDKVYVKTVGGVQTTGLYITSDDGNGDTLHLTYDILNKLIEYSKTLQPTSSRL